MCFPEMKHRYHISDNFGDRNVQWIFLKSLHFRGVFGVFLSNFIVSFIQTENLVLFLVNLPKKANNSSRLKFLNMWCDFNIKLHINGLHMYKYFLKIFWCIIFCCTVLKSNWKAGLRTINFFFISKIAQCIP